jgi:uncharacterized protein (TIGR03905 family)
MNTMTFKTSGVCSKEINIRIENDIVAGVTFLAGCDANLEGISRLIEGMTVTEVIKKLKGINCGDKGTSCPDQLAKALEQILIKNKGSIA